jgi:hypothetical protein
VRELLSYQPEKTAEDDHDDEDDWGMTPNSYWAQPRVSTL